MPWVFNPFTGALDFSGGASSYTLNGVLYGDGSAIPLVTTQGPANSVLTANAGAPSFSASPQLTSLGLGVAPTAYRQFYGYQGTLTDTAAVVYSGGYFLGANAPVANSAMAMHGLDIETKIQPVGATNMTGVQAALSAQIYSLSGTATISDMRGLNFAGYNQGPSTITDLYCMFVRYGTAASSGNVTRMYGLYLNPFHAGSGTWALHTGLYVLGPSNGGIITDNYGGKIFNQGATGIVNAYGLNILETSGASGINATLVLGAVPGSGIWSFYNNTTKQSYFGGNIGLGVTPTAYLHIKAGTATANTAPLKFDSGTLLTTAEAGAVEFLTDKFYGTITTGAARKTFAFLESPVFTGTVTLPAVTQTGLTTTYNNIATVNNGLVSEIAAIATAGLTANVGATTLYAVPATGDRLYRVSAYLVTTTAASVSSTMPNAQVVYTDADTNTAVTLDVSPILGAAGLGQSGLLTANTVATVFSGSVVIYVKVSTTIQYQTTGYVSTAAGMTYALRMRLEAL